MTTAALGISATSPAAMSPEDKSGGMRRSRSEPLLLCSLKITHPTATPLLRTSRSVEMFRFSVSSIRSLIFDADGEERLPEIGEREASATNFENVRKKRGNWVQRICEVGTQWRDRQATDDEDVQWEDYSCGVSSIRSLLFESDGEDGIPEIGEKEASATNFENARKKRANWVQRICEVGTQWRDRQAKDERKDDGDVQWEDRPCGVSYESETTIRSLHFDADGEERMTETGGRESSATNFENVSKKRAGNWVQRICEVGTQWRDRQAKDALEDDGDVQWEDHPCDVSYESETSIGREEDEWDREAFARLLNRASLAETKIFSQLAFLCNIAYSIPEIKADELRNYYGFRLVTSSLEKKQAAAIASPADRLVPVSDRGSPEKTFRSSSVAYELAASAASYIHSRAKGILSPVTEAGIIDDDEIVAADCGGDGRTYKSKMATYVAASSVTAVVAAEENARFEAARDLQSLHSSPCEWFVCDEPCTCTRCFVIQGSDSLASWQANLFFEPTEFEETTALVHRGIYEAAKGIYHQFLPEIESHLRAHGDRARFRFTGHSLGGSLSVLITLMLLARNAVPRSALHPVVTFGSPAVFCGGHRALDALSLDDTFINAVMMHRDIVPRAFSCNYPAHVARFLKRLNGSFRSHPCLNNDGLLYSPLGKQYILQPDEKTSPPHPLLPHGAALYALNDGGIGGALRAFMNAPHPLETLSQPKAYGSEGSILRDHDSKNYLLAMKALLRQETGPFFRRRQTQWWPPVTSPVAAVHGLLSVHALPGHRNVEPAAKVAGG